MRSEQSFTLTSIGEFKEIDAAGAAMLTLALDPGLSGGSLIVEVRVRPNDWIRRSGYSVKNNQGGILAITPTNSPDIIQYPVLGVTAIKISTAPGFSGAVNLTAVLTDETTDVDTNRL